jgi:hypothetical protein
MNNTALRLASLFGLLATTLVATPAFTQAEEIVVTAMRRDSRGGGDDDDGEGGANALPAITINKRADFLVQRIRLSNDTREAKARVEELYTTLRDLLAEAGKQPGIALGHGDVYLVPVTTKDYRIPLNYGPRQDMNNVELYVKLALAPTDDVKAALKKLADFVGKARMVGRTELESVGEVALTLVNPERYRYEVIGAIAADLGKLKATIGPQCQIDLTGLSGRVTWQRSDVAQLTLYIPYTVTLTHCQ